MDTITIYLEDTKSLVFTYLAGINNKGNISQFNDFL